MKPVLSAWPPKKRTTFFPVFGGGILLVSFLIIAFATQNFFLAMLVPPALAVAGAWALVGWPAVERKDGKPLVEPGHKPYLFFVLAPLLALLLYPILGIALMQAGLPPAGWFAPLVIALALLAACGVAYLLVGFPNVWASARKQYQEIPPERRPYLFFPIAVVVFLLLYLTLGVLTTKLLDRIAPGDPTPILNIQVLVLMPVCIAIACVVAWLLVGVPPILTRPRHHLPKVTGKHRPRLFAATILVGTMLFTTLVGAILTAYAPLPPTATLGVALLCGLALATGIAVLMWGTPARWRRFDDYKPGVDPRLRGPLLVGGALAIGLAVAIGIGLADIDLFWGLLAGAFAAGLALLFLTGSHRAIAARRGESTLVPDLPDAMKPLILFPTWLLITLVLFAILTYALPGLVPINLLFAVLVGLALTFFFLEQPLLKDVLTERREERRKRKEWEARRKQRLAEAEQGPPPEA